MANSFSGYVLTDKGRELQAKAETGTALNLTKMQLGIGTVDSLEEYASKTSLVSPVLSTLITSKKQSGTICAITSTVSSDGVDTGFNATELGLYAQDGDTEYLYAVSYNADSPTYVPGKGDNVSLSTTFKMQLSFSGSPTINVVLPADQEKIVTLVQDNVIKSVDAAKDAAKSEAAAAAFAKSANSDAGNAASAAADAKKWAEQSANGQINSDWNMTDTDSAAYIKNKPTKLSSFTNDLITVSSTAPENPIQGTIWIQTTIEG